jgi:sugar lactone lactonase YvrE
MGDTPVEVALSVRAQHAEGPLWDASTARLWWVDIAGERVHCFDPASSADCSWSTGGQPGGVVVGTAGEPVVSTPDGLAVLDTATGTPDLRVPIEQGRPENRANDAKVDDRGWAWVGTMAYDKRPGNAALYRVDGGTPTCVVDGLTISNGPAIDEAHRRLYLADNRANGGTPRARGGVGGCAAHPVCEPHPRDAPGAIRCCSCAATRPRRPGASSTP